MLPLSSLVQSMRLETYAHMVVSVDLGGMALPRMADPTDQAGYFSQAQ